VTELVKKYYEVEFLKRHKFHKVRANVTMERYNSLGTSSVGCKPQTIVSKVMLVMWKCDGRCVCCEMVRYLKSVLYFAKDVPKYFS